MVTRRRLTFGAAGAILGFDAENCKPETFFRIFLLTKPSASDLIDGLW